jgi:predicted dehydrogenase
MAKKMTRRTFVKGAAAGAAASGIWPAHLLARSAAAKVRLGFIGVGNRGDQLLDAFLKQPDAEVVAICDVYRPYMEAAARKAGGSPALIADHKAVLDRQDVDAVVIATPDHWHAIQTIDACRAGKDIYIEKPLSLTVAEGRKMVEAVRKANRVAQVGIQRRSSELCRKSVDLVRSGGLGKVTVAKAYHVLNESPIGIGKSPPEPPPQGLDWDLWLGPAPKVPYSASRCLYKFRWFWDYSGGQLTNFGTHYIDNVQWCLGQDAPRTITAVGGKLAIDDDREIPDTLEVVWMYPGGTLVTFSQYNLTGAPPNPKGSQLEFRGTLGTLYLDYGGFEVVPEKVRLHPVPARSPLDRHPPEGTEARISALKVPGKMDDADHARNFLDCVKTRERPACDIETGHRSTTATLLGNIALRVGRTLEWDPAAEKFTNCPEANRYLSREYRAPWKLD